MPDPLPEEFRVALADSAGRRGRFGTPVVFACETASTNDIAIALAERGASEGTLALALAQTAGRGRHGREWFSPPGAGLYISVVCRTPAILSTLTLAGGVAVADGITRATGLPVAIKWPNDVVVQDTAGLRKRRKLAGILAEGAAGPAGMQYVVLGCGINIRPADYPPALAARVTSIEHELGRTVEAALVLAEVLVALHEQTDALIAGKRHEVLARWRALSPSASGTRVEWTADRTTHSGATAGIDEDGALLVRTSTGLARIIAGEVIWY
jgi:BirA family transcriptional regulator, biotin operon repressor / biotin---[acetyl-CoA-carboxylase] ligase